MTWTKVAVLHDPPGAFPGDWVSGIYKIERYEQSIQDRLGVHYRAYYIRKPDTCWGYYVDPATSHYSTLKAAQTACERHEKERP